jgi:tetratricopeptide (TPR) repeat protein
MKTYPNCAIFDWKRIEIVSRLGYLCIVLEKYSEATEYLELYMDWMKKKPEFANFPTVALEMLKLGKLYAYLGKLKQAKYYLEKAKQIYEKLLVREDPIYRTCEEELSKVMAEYEWVMQQKDQLGVI